MSKKKKFLIVLLAAAAVIAGMAVYYLWEGWQIGTTEYAVESDVLPEEFDGYRITQVSDLHTKAFPDLTEKIAATQPDIIVITGDLIDRRHTDVEAGVEAARQMTEIAPVYFVTGNHEMWHAYNGIYDELAAKLEDIGVILMDDFTVPIEKDGENIFLTGLRDSAVNSYGTDEPSPVKGEYFKSFLKSRTTEERFDIVLFHRPSAFPFLCGTDADIIFSGHEHGGQFRIPLIAENGLFCPDEGLFPEFAGGRYDEKGTTMIVSRGLGDSVVPVRINNPPELVTVILKTKPR